MRTTLTLDDDVAAALNRLRRERDVPFRALVNDALRRGLKELREPARPARRFSTLTADLGPCLLGDIVSASEAIEQAEGPWHR
jgi:hypothetical protein